MFLKLAWRNIWRNKRRTLLTIGAVAFAVFFSSFMSAFQKGAWDHMMNSVVNSYYGFGQVHKKGYWEEQSLENSFDYKEAQSYINEVATINGSVARLESYALASFDKYTKVAFVIGTQPEQEDRMTTLSTRVSKGSYFTKEEQSVLVGIGVAKALKCAVGDTIVLLGSGYHGANAAGKFLVKGFLDFPSPELNKRMIYMPLSTAKEFYRTDDNITSLALDMADRRVALPALATLKTKLDTAQYEVLNWREMLPELQQAKEIDTAGGQVMLLVLYIIITFVLLGTILMMTKERMHEFGILTAIGMDKKRLAGTVWLEIIILGILGVIVGIILGAVVVYYFYTHPLDLAIMGEDAVKTYENFGVEPIFPAAFEWPIFIYQAVIVAILTTLLSLYPIFKILKLNPIAAMRD